MDSESICDLLQRSRDGDGDAFGRLFAAHADAVEYYIRLRLGEGLRWLKGIAWHVVLETASRVRRDRAVDLPQEIPQSGPSAGTRLRREERFERLQEAFERLSHDHRKVILLARLEKLPLMTVAERMGRSPDAVKQLLRRALLELRRLFGETESFGLADRRLGEKDAADGE